MDFNLNTITGVPYTHDYVNKYFMNPVVLLVLIGIIIVYYIIFASLGVSKGSPSGAPAAGKGGVVWLEVLLWGLFVLLLLLNGMSYFFNFDITANLTDLFTAEPNVNVLVNNQEDPLELEEIEEPEPVPEITYEKQVYHIPGNKYTYENAKAVCAAYDNRLATIGEMQDAYNRGADWCSYGWSDDQMALYPTQTSKWQTLQTIKGHKQDCGRPGINGGYISNPNIRFGINCYGYKPEITAEEADIMANASPYPITQKEIDFTNRVNYWKTQIPSILVSPFNNDNWSRT